MPPAESSDDEDTFVASDLPGVGKGQQEVSSSETNAKAPEKPPLSSRRPGRPRKATPNDAVESAPTTTNKNRVRSSDDDIENTPSRKRGRPRKQPLPPVSTTNGTQKSKKPSHHQLRSKQRTSSSSAAPTLNDNVRVDIRGLGQSIDGLLREVFVLNAIQQERGLRITQEQAIQLHSTFAPGLPAPQGDVLVPVELAESIRELLAEKEG
ncbi:hypothetical protein F4819DRAFT_509614 [Hypoxylon fuscum]|nr:hypothetical protein F4819DRAFT_509614 [Hypoxylon fuscum]